LFFLRYYRNPRRLTAPPSLLRGTGQRPARVITIGHELPIPDGHVVAQAVIVYWVTRNYADQHCRVAIVTVLEWPIRTGIIGNANLRRVIQFVRQLAIMNAGMYPQGLNDSLAGQGALEHRLFRHDLLQIGNERA
jgi:hypothetical protein